ncbi:MAG: tetratricopeptide repeat protein, partial [Thermoanaerobaculia bacterium]
IPTYLFTRRAADLNRQRNSRIAAYWYRQGEHQLANRDPEAAIASLRHATTGDRSNSDYAFTLAKALSANGHDDEARLALQRLREASPDNPEINLELARLSVRERQIPQAIVYYRHALYGVWTGENVDERRRQIRIELIHFLLDRKDGSRALAELLALSADAPDTAEAHLQLAQLFMEVGDIAHALQNFTETVRLDPENTAALQGAGAASFRLGDYKTAQQFLALALERDASSSSTAQLLETTRLIESGDPLLPRLTYQERAGRLTSALDQSLKRLEDCAATKQPVAAAQPSESDQLRTEALAMKLTITPETLRHDSELARAGADLVFKIEEETNGKCGEPQGLDRALLLIGRKYKGIER